MIGHRRSRGTKTLLENVTAESLNAGLAWLTWWI